MKKREAIQAMLDGKKVDHPMFEDKNDYLYYSHGRFTDFEGVSVDLNLIANDGWEIRQEPKKKVKFYRYWIHLADVSSSAWYSDCGLQYTSGGIKKSRPLPEHLKIHGAYIELEV